MNEFRIEQSIPTCRIRISITRPFIFFNRKGNTTSSSPRRLVLVLLRRRRNPPESTDLPRRPLPTSPARYLSGTDSPAHHSAVRSGGDTRREDNALPKGPLSSNRAATGGGYRHERETSGETARERSLSLIALLRRLHGLHHVASRDMHRQGTNGVTEGAQADRHRREAGEELQKAGRHRPLVWPHRLEYIGKN